MKVKDLDVLRPEPNFVKIGGREIDVSFIPCGIVFDIDFIMQELGTMTENDIKDNIEKQKRAFELSIKLCSIFCQHKYPELNEEWFYAETDPKQVEAFAEAIKEALTRAYAGIETEGKNSQAAKRKKSQ